MKRAFQDYTADVMALVFLSCGQRQGEREIAKEIKQLIEAEFEMDCYNADSIQGFDDVMSITDQLSKADYYLFVDFKREITEKDPIPISVFAHQEFALARAWGITEPIVFQENGLKSYGILAYVLAHPISFTRENLLEKIREEIRKRWDKNYSRNLVVDRLEASPPEPLNRFVDHTGESVERTWYLYVQNRRQDRAASNALAILHSVRHEATGADSRPDSSYLKWAGQMGFQKTIFPSDEAHFDAFSIRAGQSGVFLHSAADVHPRVPVITDVGRYTLQYRIFSESFPPVSATLRLNYVEQLAQTEAQLVR
jgi:hypothetical protein